MIRLLCQLTGAALLVHLAYRVYAFVDLYFIKTSTLPRYLHPATKSYALVTGATDGIGLAISKVLARRGFNVVLHSRNPDKLARVAEQIKAEHPDRDIVIVAADAMNPHAAIPQVVAKIGQVEANGGKLTVLVNNLGGGSLFNVPTYTAVKDMPPEAIQNSINLNAVFPIQLIRALLPKLVANTPSLIINESSYAAVYPTPLVTTYCGAKAMLQHFSTALAAEHETINVPVDVLGVLLAQVLTPGNGGDKVDFLRISSEEAADSILARVGCGRSLVCASWKHCITSEALKWFPESWALQAVKNRINELMKIEQEKLKNL